jgi:hypothetical protein
MGESAESGLFPNGKTRICLYVFRANGAKEVAEFCAGAFDSDSTLHDIKSGVGNRGYHGERFSRGAASIWFLLWDTSCDVGSGGVFDVSASLLDPVEVCLGRFLDRRRGYYDFKSDFSAPLDAFLKFTLNQPKGSQR